MKEGTAESSDRRRAEGYELPDIARRDLSLSTPYAGPVGSAEQTLAQLWSEVLRIDQVGRDDDFFELGGDSYAATVLASQIEHSFKLQFAPADIIANATVRQQALMVQTAETLPSGMQQSSFMITCQAGGKLPPVFIVHGARGFTFFNRAFLDELGSEQPVYLFQAPGMDGRTKPLTKVADYAAAYISAMRAVQPHGPYRLAAVCAGSMIALEMCHQLTNQGHEIGVLMLVDPLMVPPRLAHLYPAVVKKRRSLGGRAFVKFKRFLLACRNFADGKGFTHDPMAAEWEAELKEAGEKHAKILRKISSRRARGEGAAHPLESTYSVEDVLKSSLALDKALREYIPPPYKGHASILLNESWAEQALRDDLFWKSHLGSIDYQIFHGTHKDLFTKEVLITASFVKKCLSGRASASPFYAP